MLKLFGDLDVREIRRVQLFQASRGSCSTYHYPTLPEVIRGRVLEHWPRHDMKEGLSFRLPLRLTTALARGIWPGNPNVFQRPKG